MKHVPSFLARGEESTGTLSLARRSFLAGAAIAGLGIARGIRTLFEEDASEKTVIRPAAELPHIPRNTTEHVPTMEECEGSSLALGQRFAVVHETDGGNVERIATSIEGDGLEIRAGKRLFRLQKIIDGDMELTADSVKALLGEECVTGISVQRGLVLHAGTGDLKVSAHSFRRMVLALTEHEPSRETILLDGISFSLRMHNVAVQELLNIAKNGTCGVGFAEVPGKPDPRSLARGTR